MFYFRVCVCVCVWSEVSSLLWWPEWQLHGVGSLQRSSEEHECNAELVLDQPTQPASLPAVSHLTCWSVCFKQTHTHTHTHTFSSCLSNSKVYFRDYFKDMHQRFMKHSIWFGRFKRFVDNMKNVILLALSFTAYKTSFLWQSWLKSFLNQIRKGA